MIFVEQVSAKWNGVSKSKTIWSEVSTCKTDYFETSNSLFPDCETFYFQKYANVIYVIFVK